MQKTIYNKAYFIKKFTAIPDEKWTTGILYNKSTGTCCALGHCGMGENFDNTDKQAWTEEGWVLHSIFEKLQRAVHNINDGKDKNYQQSTPKARILAALADLPD